MIDQYGRDIHYLRISITDRCNLRCRYCMPEGITAVDHSRVLRYEEFLRIVGISASLGIRHVRVTGGEPLVRKGAAGFVASLKQLPGIAYVTMTTNGILLAEHADALHEAGLDGVNLSLDTTDSALFSKLTGKDAMLACTLAGIDAMIARRIPVKLNAVLLEETFATLPALLEFAEQGIPVRLIELMPMGAGKELRGVSAEKALALLRQRYPDLHPYMQPLGSGPARYFCSERLRAPVGLIEAISNRFCESCNRVRITSKGILKSCLCFEDGVHVGDMLRDGASDDALREAIAAGIYAKKRQHCFENACLMTERKLMSEIGG